MVINGDMTAALNRGKVPPPGTLGRTREEWAAAVIARGTHRARPPPAFVLRVSKKEWRAAGRSSLVINAMAAHRPTQTVATAPGKSNSGYNAMTAERRRHSTHMSLSSILIA